MTQCRRDSATSTSGGPSAGTDSAPAARTLLARALDTATAPRIVPAAVDRAWIAATDQRFVRRCLPLTTANQAGWWVLNPTPFQVTWMGHTHADSVVIESSSPTPPIATSHFGYGIVTFSIPFLFRTPPGYDLLVRGPANLPKDGIQPLEGIVETDWAAATFTMNWKVTRPFDPIMFMADEPVCMIVPQRRGELEEFEPEIRLLSNDSDLHTRYQSWSASRRDFLESLPRSAPGSASWQKHYFRGLDVDGTAHVDDHCIRYELRAFNHIEE